MAREWDSAKHARLELSEKFTTEELDQLMRLAIHSSGDFALCILAEIAEQPSLRL